MYNVVGFIMILSFRSVTELGIFFEEWVLWVQLWNTAMKKSVIACVRSYALGILSLTQNGVMPSYVPWHTHGHFLLVDSQAQPPTSQQRLGLGAKAAFQVTMMQPVSSFKLSGPTLQVQHHHMSLSQAPYISRHISRRTNETTVMAPLAPTIFTISSVLSAPGADDAPSIHCLEKENKWPQEDVPCVCVLGLCCTHCSFTVMF